MESVLPESPRSSPSSRTPVGALAGLPLAKILQILGGGLWRARTAPFELIEWMGGEHLDAGLASPSAGALALAPDLLAAIFPPDRPRFEEALEAWLAGTAGPEPIDYRMIVGEGELVWVRQWWLDQQPTSTPGRSLVTALLRVVSEEKRLQWEIMRTSENERSRLGQEIHDDVCQVLAGLNYLVHLLQQRLAATQPTEAAELEQINHEIQAGLERTRALAHGLLPARSDFNTLSQALRELGRQVATRFGLELVVHLPAGTPEFTQEQLLHLFRIVQEASSNSFKHARATRVEVTLERRDRCYVLAIEDDGPGFPADAGRAEGVGLNVMRNRAELLGGRLEVGNGRRGACIQVHLPPSQES